MVDALFVKESVLISENSTRPIAAVPDWFCTPFKTEAQGHVTVLLADSKGKNFEDLLAAWKILSPLILINEPLRVLLADDQRSPRLAVQLVRDLLNEDWRPDMVIGHFSSPVAHAVASLYRESNIPFFAPGSSSDRLACDPAHPVFQICGLDSEQVGGLARMGNRVSRVLIFGQKDNAGEVLAQALRQSLMIECDVQISNRLPSKDMSARRAAGDIMIALFGSKEFAARGLEAMIAWDAQALLLSDDSFGDMTIRTLASQAATPIYVPVLRQQERYLMGYEVASLEHDAMRILNRPVGPYFLTSCLAILLALHGRSKGCRSPQDFRDYLSSRLWRTPFGSVSIELSGRATGLHWDVVKV